MLYELGGHLDDINTPNQIRLDPEMLITRRVL